MKLEKIKKSTLVFSTSANAGRCLNGEPGDETYCDKILCHLPYSRATETYYGNEGWSVAKYSNGETMKIERNPYSYKEYTWCARLWKLGTLFMWGIAQIAVLAECKHPFWSPCPKAAPTALQPSTPPHAYFQP